METLHLVLNAVTVIFIAATMFAAGLGTTVPRSSAGASVRCSASPPPP
ncbi:hypothetical protein ACIP4Y_27655 [Streptomyces sp. NPDC088810]